MSDHVVNDCPKGGTHVFPSNGTSACVKCGAQRLVSSTVSAFHSALADVPKMDDYEIVVEMPMSGHRAYGCFFTSRATDDDILRIRRGDRDLVRLHPDGRIEAVDDLDKIEEPGRPKRTLPPYVNSSVVVRVLRALAGTTAPVELDADYDLVKGSPWIDFAAAKLIQTSKWVEEHDGSVGQIVMNLHEVSTARVEGATPTDYCFAMAMGARDEATGDIHWRIDPYVVRQLNVEMPGDGTTTFKVMAREPPPGVLRPLGM